MKASEREIAAIVVAYLVEIGADVYQEVTVPGGVADIVCRLGAEIWIIEVKTSPSLALLTQAMDRRRLCHRVYVAAPYTRTMREFGALAAELGIGVLEVQAGSYDSSRVTERVTSRRWNSRPVALAGKLRPEHKTHARAGAIGGGGRWTPFRDTCEQLAREVRRAPGVTLKAAIGQITHHYASGPGARSSLAKWIETGKVAGVELRRINGVAALYPTERVA